MTNLSTDSANVTLPATSFIPSPAEMRILVIEDQPDLRAGIVHALRKQGYAVDAAADGAEGLHQALTVDYDAIVLDVMLPLLDGWAVLAGVRESKTTPVLMLTARDSTADRVRGLDGGADDYLVKPFDVAELQARLRVMLRRGKREAQTVIQIGGVTLDTAARTIACDGAEVTLTAREYSVLEYLARHRGVVVTRTTLYDHLGDESDDTMSNVIDVHVYQLRKKLGAGFITTRRGHGYVLA